MCDKKVNRDEFLIQDLYHPDEVVSVYSHVDRMVTLGCMPVKGHVSIEKGIDCWKNFGTRYFLERREIGIFNIGGAHGIGFAIAESYAEAGATVVFNCSSEASLERGLAAYKEKGIDAHGYVCDVTDEEAVKKMIADIEEKIGTVDILVNNAGMIKRIPMHEMSAD